MDTALLEKAKFKPTVVLGPNNSSMFLPSDRNITVTVLTENLGVFIQDIKKSLREYFHEHGILDQPLRIIPEEISQKDSFKASVILNFHSLSLDANSRKRKIDSVKKRTSFFDKNMDKIIEEIQTIVNKLAHSIVLATPQGAVNQLERAFYGYSFSFKKNENIKTNPRGRSYTSL
jgi:hypothetical protein